MIIRMKKESPLKIREDLMKALTDKGYVVKDMSGPMCGVLGVMGDTWGIDIDEIEKSEGVEGVAVMKANACKSHAAKPETLRMRVFPAAE